MTKQSYFTKIRRIRIKREAVKRLGGKCKKCGWSGDLAGFHFHHRNPKEKKFLVGATTNWEKYWLEVQKCDLLCSICHDVLHSDCHDEEFLEAIKKYGGRDLIESDVPWKNQTLVPTIYTKECLNCEKPYTTSIKKQRYCSLDCRNEKYRKVKRPSKEELKRLTETMPMTKIGKMFGVSDNAVRKWIKKL